MFESKTIQTSAVYNNKKKLLNKKDVEIVFVNFQTQEIYWRFSNREIAIRIFITCWFIFTLFFATNTVREIYPALSLGDHLSFDVTEYNGLHPDIFEMSGRGAFINNNPGASMMGAIPYILFRPITDRIIDKIQKSRLENSQSETVNYDTIYPMAKEFYLKSKEKGYDVKFGLAAGILQAFCMAPISALATVVMFWLFLSLTNNTKTSVLLALLYAFATPVFYRTAQINQNLLLAHFTLFAFVLLWRPWCKDKKPFYFLAGLCTGWTVVLDYSGLVSILVLSIYAIYLWLSVVQDDRKFSDLMKFSAGVFICASILMIYQWYCFGNPILPAQSYMPPANFTDLGYRGFSFPSLDLLVQTAFSMRYGLFVSAPILILAFFAPFWLNKKSRLLEKSELIFVVSFVVLFFIFCSSNQYGRMQFNTGVRHIVPVIPFLFILVANVLIKIPKTIAVFIAILGTYWSLCLVMYRDVEQGLGVFESLRHITFEGFRFPWLSTIERMGYIQNASTIPLLLLSAVLIWALWNIGAKNQNSQF